MEEKSNHEKAHAVGINHVAIEVANVAQALDFYSRFLHFQVEDVSEAGATIYFGDQFINLMRNNDREPDKKRHFGIAVDDKELVRETLNQLGVTLLPGRFLDFFDPWGNRVEITTYQDIQFTKADHVLHGMKLGHLKKSDKAVAELAEKEMAPKRPIDENP